MRSRHPTWHNVGVLKNPLKEGRGKKQNTALLRQRLRGRSCPPPKARPTPLAPRCCACATPQRRCSFHRAGAPEVLSAARARKERSGVERVLREISELRIAMLSPEAERVLRYLVEVEELAEAVLSDKRQVRDSAAASSVRERAPPPLGSRLPFTLPLPLPRIFTLCRRLPRYRFPNAILILILNEVA